MTKKLSIFSIFLLSLLSIILFLPPSTYALSTVTKISNSTNDVTFPQTVTDSKGYLHAVWMEVTQGQIWTGSNPGIYYSRWNGDTWSTPLKISANTGFAATPSITVGTDDIVHVVWDDETYAGDNLPVVVYRTRSVAGIWSVIETLTRPAGTITARFAKIAINTTNEPTVFYTSNTDGYKDSIYWTRKTAGVWTTPELISKNASNQNIIDTQWVDVRQDTLGNVYMIYWSFSQSVFYRKYSAGVWSTPFQVNTSGNIESIRLGVTPNGEVFVTWYQVFDTTVNVRWTQAGVWQTATALTNLGQRSYLGLPIMGVTTDSKERAHVGWGEKDPTDGLIDLKYRSFVAGTWQAAQDVDLNNNDADAPYVYPDKWDNQHFMWAEKNSTTGIWELMYRVAEGTIQNVTTAGGTITANPNNVTELTLSIPNGALSSTQQIAVQIGPVPENVDPSQITIPKAYTFRPNGLTFSTPATAKIFYTNAEVAGADETLLKPWVWDSVTATWSAQIVTSRNIAQNTMDVSLNHFSLYGISAPRVVVSWKEPSSSSIKGNNIRYSFGLGYANGNPFRALTQEDAISVVLKNSNGEVISTDVPSIDKKTIETIWNGGVQIKGKSQGSYFLEMHLNGSLMDSKQLTL